MSNAIVTRAESEFTLALEGNTVGLMTFVARDVHRVFLLTQVKPAFGAQGLAPY